MNRNFKNRLKIVGEESADVEAVKNYLQGKNEDNKFVAIDFNKIIPMPESLNIQANSNAKLIHYLLFGDPDGINMISLSEAKEKIKDLGIEEKMEAFDLALKYEENKKAYGHISSITWKNENWKVDSNASNVRYISDVEIEFETENDGILYLIAESAKKFPNIKLEYNWELAFRKYSSVFKNGSLIEIEEENTFFQETNKFKDIASYYNK